MTDTDSRVWKDVLAHLRRYQPAICRQWFDELAALGLDTGVLRIRTLSVTHRDYLQKQCLQAFNDAVQVVTNRLVAVRFLAPQDQDEAAAPPHHSGLAPAPKAVSPATPDVASRRDALVINPDNTFANFVIGHSNRIAHAAAVAVGEKPGQRYNPLFIYGGVGLGKTHLLQAICLRILETRPETDLYYLSCDGFMTQYIECVQDGTMPDFRHKFRDVDVLAIDDIHFLAKGEQSQEEFFHTFNALHTAGKQIILSSDAAPEDIPQLQERLVSRFKQGMVAQVEPPNLETRVAIVKQKALLRGLELPDDVAGHIAGRIDTNIRELEGAITRLQMQATLDKRTPDLGMSRQVLGEVAPRVPTGEPTIHAVIRIVTEFYGVRVPDLQSKRRHRSITTPRQVCMYLARRHTRHSLEEIGGHFGGRDHTTVMHAVQTVEERRKQSPDFDQQVAALDHKISLNERIATP
jgi:chromosomal replication initiator protein